MSEERELASRLVDRIAAEAKRIDRPVRLMEVCGTHTVELRRQGIHSLLPDNVTMISGPGCPVCVTPAGYIDNTVDLARSGQALIATFGDMLKVPGTDGVALSSLLGTGRVRVLYSPNELPALARSSKLPVVFLAIGFETTIPTVVSALLEAREQGIDNLLVYTAFRIVCPALRYLLSDPANGIDAFLLPGHVSVILGTSAYRFLEDVGGRPGVITGFEPLDMLLGILMSLRQVSRGQRRVENAYPRAVKPNGSPVARAVMERALEPADETWRGIGVIPGGALKLRKELANADAAVRFSLPEPRDHEAPGCLCSSVIAGKARPPQCAHFGSRCTPDNPVGPCMVSSEGTCAAYFRYGADR